MAIFNDPTVALRIAFNVITVGIAIATISATVAVSIVVAKGLAGGSNSSSPFRNQKQIGRAHV